MSQQRAFGELVGDPELVRFGGIDGPARDDHLDRANGADDSRQALRPSRTGEQSQPDLRETELRGGRRNPEMTSQHELEPAAERSP
jgi:hypothetical protein